MNWILPPPSRWLVPLLGLQLECWLKSGVRWARGVGPGAGGGRECHGLIRMTFACAFDSFEDAQAGGQTLASEWVMAWSCAQELLL